MKLTFASMFIATRWAPSVSASGMAASILKHKNNQGSVRLSAPKNKECSLVDGFKVNVQKSLQVGIPICEIGELCEEDSTSPLGGRCVTVSSKPVALTPQRQLVGRSWIKLGQDINGEAAGDQSGRSVSLSSDGNVLAIGAYLNDANGSYNSGHVRVFKLDTNIWTQVGQDIDGVAACDYFGSSVSLSGNGNVLAIGAYLNDANGISDSGHVRVFKLDTNIWTQVGEDIDGVAASDRFGSSVSLSSDGSVLAIGAPYNDANGSYNSGHVRVFKLDGNVLAIGAPSNDANGSSNSGHVRVFKLDHNSWTQVGQDINGEAAIDYSGWSVSLSSDGNVLAIGAYQNDANGSSNSGHVRVFKLDTNTDSWTQVGEDIDGVAAGDRFGSSVSLSSDGNVLAIGATSNDGSNRSNSGHVRVFKLDTNTDSWTQVGQDIDGEAASDQSGWSVSLSSDGNVLAIGATGNDGSNRSNSGHVRVFSFPITSTPTAAPVTPGPTAAPVTSTPMAAPVTSTPTAAPITPGPTAAPVTSTPTVAPVTPGPTAAPVTSSPAAAPVTPSPSAAPVTTTPMAAPVTPSPVAAPMSTPGWNITYDSMKANLTADTTEELIFVYDISS
eukprot:scaffold13403_cov40-Cyclotella_meneghiniana.AAC.1